MNRMLLIGLNHTTAPLAVRERLAFAGPQQREAIVAFRERFPRAEVVLVCTCNRVELYAAREIHGHPRVEEMIAFLCGCHGLPESEVAPHLYHKADLDAVNHLFSVASSLDSMVLGETQILGQVRAAYEMAGQAGTAGAMLHPLFQRAIAVGKQVMHSTALSEGRVSVASVAVDYARRIFESFADKTVLTIGAGKMARLALTSFRTLGPGRLLVCNRDPVKGQALAAQFGGTPAVYERLSDHLVAADIVISSTGATEPILTRQAFERLLPLRRYRPLFLIDIALPRDVEESVGQLDNVYLYNLDDLQQVVSATQAQRSAAIADARRIIDREVQEFAAWSRTRQVGPLIDSLYRRAHAMAAAELERTVHKLGEVSESERAHLEDLARRIVNKLLHDPVQTLRSGVGLTSGPGVPLASAVEQLFGLRPPEDDAPASPASPEAHAGAADAREPEPTPRTDEAAPQTDPPAPPADAAGSQGCAGVECMPIAPQNRPA